MYIWEEITVYKQLPPLMAAILLFRDGRLPVSISDRGNTDKLFFRSLL